MYIPLGIKTDYSLLKSLIKIPDLMTYLKNNNITACGILDENLFGSICFYESCLKNNIKPIIGLIVKINDNNIYLYAKNYEGFQNLLKVNTLIQDSDVNYISLKLYNNDIICVVPYKANKIYDELCKIYNDIYIGYGDQYEKKNGKLLCNNLVYVNETVAIEAQDIKYISILREIDNECNVDLSLYNNSYLNIEVLEEDVNSTIDFSSLINITIPKNNRYIPHYDKNISDSYSYLTSLCKKGLDKRLNGNVSKEYINRLEHELNIINSMGFVDYFLIVYDYVKYAKVNNIFVGPGRGSAAGSLVSYVLGITNIDPIKYNLLFERFLNPHRVTMPDIDIDFESIRREEVIAYVKERYGINNVASIMTYGTLAAKQAIRDVSRVLKIDNRLVERLSSLINSDISLKDNLKNDKVKELVSNNNLLKKVYKISIKLEDLKKNTSKHAAGVVISSININDVIPILKNGDDISTGCTMEYLEDLGLLKMDFLAIRNLTAIHNVLDMIEENDGVKINLNSIPLDDKKTYELLSNADTDGIFQFEGAGYKSFLNKLKPECFDDLIAAVALYRPGPMNNIDSYVNRKNGKEEVIYPDSSLEEILNNTYGIMIYQEQIMQILVKMGDYSVAEADNIRRAMSKKKKDVMEHEREVFVNRSEKNGYTNKKANEIYDLIIKFADYGFAKAHSVGYALVCYQMAYLKSNYPVYYIANLLDMSLGSVESTKKFILEAKRKYIRIFKPNINVSIDSYMVKDNALLLPLNSIKNVSLLATNEIVNERNKNGRFIDFYDFVIRVYGKNVNKKTIEALINGDCFRDFNYNHNTLINMIDSAIDYASLCSDLDESLVMKPNMVVLDEYDDNYLMENEVETFGYYVTNHPASKYQDGIMKLKDIRQFFDKYVNLVVIIGNVRKIKTKKGEDMGFISGSDETDTGDFTIFPKNAKLLDIVNKNDLVKIRGQVTRRNDKFQIVVSNIEKV
ncbi:MAG: DNA polymerase III subunit alpha [Candidatus Coprovivens sp.]